jgi:predicted ArsR family transcriptional regulator
MSTTPPTLSTAKRRIVDALKRRAQTGPELAERFSLTTEAVRLHLNDLAGNGLIRSTPRATTGPGRPPVEWSLTELAVDLFPDRHADLTVSLIGSIRSIMGDEALDTIVAARTAEQIADYRHRMTGATDRLEALAAIRSDEGYMAEVVDSPDGRGRLLIEHHCPICDAARACTNLCSAELDRFRDVLGPGVEVIRTQQLIQGDQRGAYRLRLF